LEDKGFIVSFIDGEVLMLSRGKSIDDSIVIFFQEGGLYKLKGHSDPSLVHNTINPSELWHRRFSHLHYKELPIVSKMVTCMLLGYEKSINIFIFPTFHDIILIEFSVI
jgi:hypothetical protein